MIAKAAPTYVYQLRSIYIIVFLQIMHGHLFQLYQQRMSLFLRVGTAAPTYFTVHSRTEALGGDDACSK